MTLTINKFDPETFELSHYEGDAGVDLPVWTFSIFGLSVSRESPAFLCEAELRRRNQDRIRRSLTKGEL